MIYINLLPWREERDAQTKSQFIKYIALTAACAAAGIALWYAAMFKMIDNQDAVNTKLTEAIDTQTRKISEIKNLKEQIQMLVARKKVVETLQNNRNQATRIFEQLGTRLPEGVIVKSIKQVGPKITLVGVALNNTLVSKTMNAIETSAFFEQPILVEIRAVDAKSPAGGTIKASEFTMDFKYHNPDAPAEKTADTKKK